MRTPSRGQRNAHWIEKFCVLPNGPNKGQRVVLTPAQRDIVRQVYNIGENRPMTALAVSGIGRRSAGGGSSISPSA